ncbi:hypothetical protein CEXT_648961 [Caerostris extrusa]|uniref:Uncharacterized protein n=1 Tax=Caerostris extrusa TaxID=172846 RepID=A0AAV4VK39_CAEEX|nr:hypothetical protein CEXT_648961 [Caerostris extrusa]
MNTSDIFHADKTCLFCEKRKCKYAIITSEVDPLTPLTSVHGIDKVFRLLYPSKGIAQNVRLDLVAWLRLHKVTGDTNEKKEKKDSVKVPSQNLPPVSFYAELQVLFLSVLLPGRDGCSRKPPLKKRWERDLDAWLRLHKVIDLNEKKKKKKRFSESTISKLTTNTFSCRTCKFYSCPDCYTDLKLPSRDNGKVSEKNKQQISPLDMRVVKKVSPRNRKNENK